MDEGEPQVLSLTPAEHALYSSGIRRGHAETLGQIAGQLRNAAETARRGLPHPTGKTTKAGLLEALNGAISGYESFAGQLDVPANEARAEQQQLLARFCRLRDAANRSPAARLRAAVRGALGGWRGEW